MQLKIWRHDGGFVARNSEASTSAAVYRHDPAWRMKWLAPHDLRVVHHHGRIVPREDRAGRGVHVRHDLDGSGAEDVDQRLAGSRVRRGRGGPHVGDRAR